MSYIYVMVIFPAFVIFEGPFDSGDAAYEHVATIADLRPSASQRVVLTDTVLPVGKVIEFDVETKKV
jgi:hypothetical protein